MFTGLYIINFSILFLGYLIIIVGGGAKTRKKILEVETWQEVRKIDSYLIYCVGLALWVVGLFSLPLITIAYGVKLIIN